MRHLKQFYYFLIKLLKGTLVNFTDPLTLARFENGLQTFWSKLFALPGNESTPKTKKSMTAKESSKKASEKLLQDLQDLEDSSFIVADNGKLYHRALRGLELNAVYENKYDHLLMFGYEGS